MKLLNKIAIALSIAAASVSFTSCDVLDIMQDNQISASNMWKDATDVTTSTNGIYYRLRSNFVSNMCNMYWWGEVRVGAYMWTPSLLDNANNSDMTEVRTSTMTGATASCSWSALYTTIDQANSVLKYAPQVEMTDAERGFAIGQAAFARAFCYFYAARLWGDVPLNLLPIESTTQEETYPVRAPKADVYAQIMADIDTAVENAQYLGTNQYLATAAAVYMLKAEYGLWMYATQGGKTSYLDYADSGLKALGISKDKLLGSYYDVFDRNNKKNKEVVFALNNNQTEKLTGGYYWYFYHTRGQIADQYRQNPVPINATQWMSYSQNFLDILLESKAKNNDSRVDRNLGYGMYHAEGEAKGYISWPNKYLGDMSGATTVFDCDIMYYRYAQAVMMDAELKYYRGQYTEALNSLNIIAERAYGKPNFYTDATKDAVLEALVDEYFLEFPCEGVIWWSLIRLDKIWEYNPELKAKQANNPNILLWPISTSAINKNNKLRQTEGWS